MKYLFLVITTFFANIGLGQIKDTTKVYHVNKWVSGGIVVGGAITNTLGRTFVLQKKDPIPISTLNQLNREDLFFLDRVGLDQDIEKRERWEEISDLGFTASNILPFFLFLDKDISKDWKDIVFLYLETQVISSNAFTNNPLGPLLIDKFRPRAYYQDLPLSEREGGNNKNSFFSGHASITASASFFMAKVYADYHPEMKGKFWLYSAALLPPAVVSLGRVKGLFHFPSDVLTGTAVGAFIGILIPQLHKNKKNLKLSLFQFQDASGLSIGLKF